MSPTGSFHIALSLVLQPTVVLIFLRAPPGPGARSGRAKRRFDTVPCNAALPPAQLRVHHSQALRVRSTCPSATSAGRGWHAEDQPVIHLVVPPRLLGSSRIPRTASSHFAMPSADCNAQLTTRARSYRARAPDMSWQAAVMAAPAGRYPTNGWQTEITWRWSPIHALLVSLKGQLKCKRRRVQAHSVASQARPRSRLRSLM